MKLLILGGLGMLGHKLCQVASRQAEVAATLREPRQSAKRLGLPKGVRLFGSVSATHLRSVQRVIARARPNLVVNCIGIVKQAREAQDPLASISVNALFPHHLCRLCGERGARLIHLSTDCVFSGRKGAYAEGDPSDAEDLYGRSKYLGEVAEPHCVTVRTSMIGRELRGAHGLVEWFLAQNGKQVHGFGKSIFSGLTTQALSDVLLNVVASHLELSGVWHVAGEPISKLDLLGLLKDAYHLDIDIEPDDRVVVDRSLDGSRFRAKTGFSPPAWRAMIAEMAADPTPYEALRRKHARR